MQISIRQKNLEVTPALASYIETKIVKPLERMFKKSGSSLPMIELEIERTTHHHRKGKIFKVEAKLTFAGKVWHAEVEEEDVHTACDLLKEELEREITKTKGKSVAVSRRNARAAKKEINLDSAAQILGGKGGRVRDEGN